MLRLTLLAIKGSLKSHKKTIIGSLIATLIGVSVATLDDINKTVRSTKNNLDSFKEKQLSENIYVAARITALKETINHYIDHNDSLWSKQAEANEALTGNVKREAGFEAGEDRRISADEQIEVELVNHELKPDDKDSNKNSPN